MSTPTLTTTPVAEIKVLVTGDIGGNGVSRWRFIRNDAGVITIADCNAAGAAVRQLYFAVGEFPTGITFSVSPNVELFDIGSGLVQGSINMSSVPPAVTGGLTGNYVAGTGIRVNWKTNTVQGRRMLRGATFLVPCGNAAFAANGAVPSVVLSRVSDACAAYVTAMATANLVPVIWHRPPTHTTSGGVVGPVVGGVPSSTPASLRSRRS